MMRDFEAARGGSASMLESNGMDASPAAGIGNAVCGCWCDDSGNAVCGCRERRVASLRRGAVSLRDWWRLRVPVGLGVEMGTELDGSLHWTQGVSGVYPVMGHSQRLLGIWRRNKGWFA